MEQQFTLSKSNKIYYGITAIAFIGVSIVVGDISSVTIGKLVGKLIGFLLLPSLFAWIVWRLSGKNERRKSLTFNIVLTLALLGQVGQAAQRAQQHQQLNELSVYKEEFKETVSKDPETFNSAYNKFMDSSKAQLDTLSKTGTDSEKQFFEVMREFMSEVQAVNQDWNDSLAAIQSPEILDYALLNSDEVFESQKKTIQFYLDKTKTYQVFHKGILPNLKERLSIFEKDNTLAKDALEGATDKYLSQKPIVEPLIQAHLDYGNDLLQMLEFLRKNQGEWTYTNSELNFNADDMLNQYSEILKEVGKNEAIINTLSQKLIENI